GFERCISLVFGGAPPCFSRLHRFAGARDPFADTPQKCFMRLKQPLRLGFRSRQHRVGASPDDIEPHGCELAVPFGLETGQLRSASGMAIRRACSRIERFARRRGQIVEPREGFAPGHKIGLAYHSVIAPPGTVASNVGASSPRALRPSMSFWTIWSARLSSAIRSKVSSLTRCAQMLTRLVF